MASSIIFVTLALVAAASVPASVMGTDFMVGDDKGWTLNFDYQTWAGGKQFYVGDRLVFKYPESVHNVLKVNGTGFQQCAAPVGTVPLATGNDVIPLLAPGRKWYICGVGKHCAIGMKLVITVLPKTESPAPAPVAGEASAAGGSIAPRYCASIMAVFGIIAMVMV
ncbi:blue copper protein 1b-like [Syzygium oleosum]|uniref:blue copper protein 1b-like n=1 Tax=Syzygium oleosum TaxID=219896 RepID=UPI0011D29BD1|nr:blue copper protein 1b-like [Syzygium oleosum]